MAGTGGELLDHRDQELDRMAIGIDPSNSANYCVLDPSPTCYVRPVQSRAHWRWAWSISSLVVLCPCPARAQTSPLDLVWVAPPTCPEGGTVREQVLRLAHVGAEGGRYLRARVTIAEISEGNWQLELTSELGGVTGERTLKGRSCQAVAEAATLTLALILNPEFQRSEESRDEEQPVRSSPSPVRMATTPPASATAPPPRPGAPRVRHRVRGLALSEMGLGWGTLPRATPELTMGLGLGLGSVSAWVVASYNPVQHAFVEGQAGGRLWAGALSGLGCWEATSRSLVVGSCLGLDVRRLEGFGTGVTDPRTGVVYWLSPTLGITGGLRLAPRIELRVAGFGSVPLARPSVYLERLGQVHQPDRVGGRVVAGVVVDW